MEICRVCFVLKVLYLIFGSRVLGCPDNCVSCTGNQDNVDQCQLCKEGYWLQHNYCLHCLNGCATCTNFTHCIKCETNYWNIEKGCYSMCFNGCDGSGCDDKTGFCNRCPSGFYGKYCLQYCKNCKNNSCELHQCKNGCDDGYYEFATQGYKNCKKCRYKCTRCEGQPICLECEKGHYKYRHNSSGSVSVTCRSCNPSCEECNSYKYCTVCIPGKYGSQCENNCTLSDCFRCSKYGGVETCTECDSAYELEDNKCVPCENKSRVCLSGCPNGYWGIHCNKTCFKGCASSQCRQINGSCDTCRRNYYGDACQFMCSDFCADDSSLLHICTKSDGTCERGCNDGYNGDRCNIALASKLTITQSAEKTAFTTLKASIGKIMKPTTSSGNLDVTEETYGTNDKMDSQQTVLSVGTGTGGGVFLIVLVVVTIVCIVRKRRQGSLDEKREYVNLTEMMLATISDRARGAESHEHRERTIKISENVYATLQDELRDSQHYYSGMEITTD